MGNISYLIPTKNQEDFNLEKIASLISDNFKKTKVEIYDNNIQVFKKNNLIMDIYFDSDCYLIDFEKDLEILGTGGVSYLSEDERNNLINWLEKLRELNPEDSYKWKGPSIDITHGFSDLRTDIEFLLKDYFYAFIFDEGIHPDFMPPDYVRKTKSSKIKKFVNFLKNL